MGDLPTGWCEFAMRLAGNLSPSCGLHFAEVGKRTVVMVMHDRLPFASRYS